MKFCNNCMGSCIHLKIHSNLDDGFYCDKNPEGFKKWHEEHRKHTYEIYKDFSMDCYEGSESSNDIRDLITLTENLLKELK